MKIDEWNYRTLQVGDRVFLSDYGSTGLAYEMIVVYSGEDEVFAVGIGPPYEFKYKVGIGKGYSSWDLSNTEQNDDIWTTKAEAVEAAILLEWDFVMDGLELVKSRAEKAGVVIPGVER